MPANDRGGLKAAFTNFNRKDTDKEAELKLLGRTVKADEEASPAPPGSYHAATSPLPPIPATGLMPRPLMQREAVRQLSFRCPVSVAAELRKKAAFNQLEQQQIIIEGVRRVLADLPEPPADWREY